MLFIASKLLALCVYFVAIGIVAMLVGLVVRFVPELGGPWQRGLFIALTLINTLIRARIKLTKKRGRGTLKQVKEPPLYNKH